MASARQKKIVLVLHEGEIFGLVFTAALLVVVEACFVYWLNHIQLPDRPLAQSGFLVFPPWHQKPRFEVTLLLTIAAGILFSAVRGLWELWRGRNQLSSTDAISSLQRRINTAASVTALAGFNLALATWLR